MLQDTLMCLLQKNLTVRVGIHPGMLQLKITQVHLICDGIITHQVGIGQVQLILQIMYYHLVNGIIMNINEICLTLRFHCM